MRKIYKPKKWNYYLLYCLLSFCRIKFHKVSNFVLFTSVFPASKNSALIVYSADSKCPIYMCWVNKWMFTELNNFIFLMNYIRIPSFCLEKKNKLPKLIINLFTLIDFKMEWKYHFCYCIRFADYFYMPS